MWTLKWLLPISQCTLQGKWQTYPCPFSTHCCQNLSLQNIKLKRVKDVIRYFVYTCTLFWTICRDLLSLWKHFSFIKEKKPCHNSVLKKIKGGIVQLWWMHFKSRQWILCIPISTNYSRKRLTIILITSQVNFNSGWQSENLKKD